MKNINFSFRSLRLIIIGQKPESLAGKNKNKKIGAREYNAAPFLFSCVFSGIC